MNWGTELWDKYDVICNHTDHAIEFVKRMSNFMKDRANVEQSYAKELRQLVKKYTKKEEADSRYSSVRAFAKIVAETNDLAGQREIISERIKSEVNDALKSLAKDLTAERKKIMADGHEELRKMKNQLLELERLKQKYDKSCEELDTAKAQFEKADADPNMTRAKIEKFNNIVRQKETACEEAKNTYWLFLDTTNGVQRKHYETDMPAVFTRFQEMEISRMNKLCDKIHVFADCQRGVMTIVGKCLDNMDEAAKAIDPNADCQVVVEGHKSGFSPPGDLEFQEWGKQALKKSTHANLFASKAPKSEPKEDFSHLPPAQQKKKLKAKIQELESAIHKSTSDKNAMEKMIAIYRQNPALGDEKAVSQSLEETLVKVDEQNAVLYKFKCYLHKVDGKGEPEKPQFISSRPPPLVSFESLNKTPEPPPPKKTSPPVKTTPAKPVSTKDTTPPKPQEDEFEDEEDDDDEEEDGEGQTGTVLYNFARLRYKNLRKKVKDDPQIDQVETETKYKEESSMFRKKTFSFSKRRSAGSPPPDTKDADTGRERAHSESGSTFARSNERKSFRKLKDFIGGHKDKANKKQELKSTISNPIPVNVKRYGVDNTDYITGLPLQPKDQVKRVGVEEEINVYYNSLPRPKKSTPEQVAIISGRTGSFSCGTFSRSGSIRSTGTYQMSTLQRPPMHPRRKVPPIPLESKHNSVSSEESGVSVSYECEDSQRLEKSKWFHGIVKPTLADKALKKHGDFLVRENVSGTPLYYASVLWSDAIHHIPIKMVEMFPGGGRTVYKYSFDEGAFDSVPQLVHAHMKYKIPVEQFSGILLVNPINKGSHYEDIDDADQDKNIQEKEPAPDHEHNVNSSTNLPEMKNVDKYPVPSNVLLDRDVRSQSVPTPIASSTAIKSPEHHPDSSSQPSLSKMRSSILVEDEEDDTYMEMSSVKSFHECPPDYRCGSSSPRRGASFSATPEPMYTRSSTPSFHSSATEISRTRTPNYSPYSVSKRNRSGLLSHTQSPPIAEPPIKYDMTSTVARSGKGLLDDPSVQAIVGKVLETSTDQLAFHTTLADAVNFKLLPHPGESEESWWKRMKEEGSMRGLLAGLEVLGSPQGERLWNSLWSRHHMISQWVVLCVTSMESLKTRTKLLSKFIDLARVLQGTKYSNVFGFMAVMDGLNTVQIAGLKKTWEALQTDYPDLYQSYTNQLIDVYTQVHQGEKVFALEYVTVPSIQQLGEIFLPKVDTFNPKHYHNGDVKDLMAGLDHFAQGFVQLREMLQHCPTFHWNARKKLSGVAINSDLYTYLMRDHPRDLLHQLKLEKNLDNSHQRRRMFNHILEILSDAAEPKQLGVSST